MSRPARPAAGIRPLPVLVFDGDCAFCTTCARLLARIGPQARIVAWQLTDPPALGLTESQAADAVQWVQVDGAVHSGHEAIAGALTTAGPSWKIIGRVIMAPGISWVAARIYRLVSDNRHRLPGGTPACRAQSGYPPPDITQAASRTARRPPPERRRSPPPWQKPTTRPPRSTG